MRPPLRITAGDLATPDILPRILLIEASNLEGSVITVICNRPRLHGYKTGGSIPVPQLVNPSDQSQVNPCNGPVQCNLAVDRSVIVFQQSGISISVLQRTVFLQRVRRCWFGNRR